MNNQFSPNHHFNNNVLPLIESNNELKLNIQSILHYYESQRISLSNLIADYNSQGQSRELIKQIADYPSLIKLLEFDLKQYKEENKNMKQTLLEQSQKIQQFLVDPHMIQHQQQLKQKINRLEEKEQDSAKLIETLQQNLKNQVSNWRNQYQQLNETITKQSDSNTVLQQDYDQLKQKYSELQEQFQDKLMKINNENEENLMELEEQNKKILNETIQAYEMKIENLTLQYEEKIQNIEQELILWQEKFNIIEESKQKVNLQLLSLQDNYNNTLKEKQHIQNKMNNLKDQYILQTQQMKQIKVLKESTDRQNSIYNKQLFDLQQDHETLKLQKNKLNEDLQFIIQQQKKEIQELKQIHATIILQMQNNYQQRAQDLELDFLNRIQKSKEKYNKKVKQIRQQIEDQFLLKYGVSVKEILDKPPEEEVVVDIESLQNQIIQDQEKLKEQEDLLKQSEIQNQQLQYKLDQEEKKIKNIQKETEERIDKDYKVLFMQMGQDFHNRLTNLEETNKQEIETIKKNSQIIINQAIEQKQEIQVQMEQLHSEYIIKTEQINQLSNQIEQLIKNKQKLEEELSQLNQFCGNLNASLQEKENQIKDVSQQKKQLSKKLEHLQDKETKQKEQFQQKSQEQKKVIERKVNNLIEEKQELEQKCKHLEKQMQKYIQAKQQLNVYKYDLLNLYSDRSKINELELQLQQTQSILEYCQKDIENYKQVYNIFKPVSKESSNQDEQRSSANQNQRHEQIKSVRQKPQQYNNMTESNAQQKCGSILPEKNHRSQENTERKEIFRSKFGLQRTNEVKVQGVLPNCVRTKQKYRKCITREKINKSDLSKLNYSDSKIDLDNSQKIYQGASRILNSLYDIQITNPTMESKSKIDLFNLNDHSSFRYDKSLQVRQMELLQSKTQQFYN